MELSGRVALVTGAAKRVGREIALELARGGADVVVHYARSGDEAESVAEEIRAMGRQAWAAQADLADARALATMLDHLPAEVDVLVNSASVFYPTPLETSRLDEWDHNIQVNLRAPFLLSQRLGLQMRGRGAGKIINIVDCSIRRPYREHLPYLVSKSALMAMTELLALELAPQVQVNAVAPGTVLLPPDASKEYEAQAIRRAPLKKLGSPCDVARMVRYLVEHGDWMTGGYYPVDGGAGMR